MKGISPSPWSCYEDISMHATMHVQTMCFLFTIRDRILAKDRGCYQAVPVQELTLEILHPVHTALSTVLLWLGCYWPCKHPLWFRVGLHAEARWPIRSHDQVRNLQYDSNRPVRQAPVTRTQFIDSKQATPTAFDPCRLAGVATMDFRDTPSRSIVPRPWPLYWWTHSLKIKYLSVIFSGRQPMAR
jgi:hypothetical protein